MDNRRIFSIDDDAGFRSFLKDFLAPTDLESVVTGDAEKFNEAYAEMAETMGLDRGLKNVMSLTKPVRLTDLRQALHIPQPDEG